MKVQNVFRKALAIVLAFGMVFGVMQVVVPDVLAVPSDVTDHTTQPLPFTDVTPTDWFYEQVRFVFEYGLMTGTDVVTFSPGATVTRAMVVQVLYNHVGRPTAAWMHNPFADVSDGAWYRDAIVWAFNSGIAGGIGGDRFAPRDYITRAHLIIMLNNYAIFMGAELPALRDSQAFADEMDIRSYAREAIDRFFMAMIINGRPDGTFDPQGSATRAELATILSGFVLYSENLNGGGNDLDLPVPPYGFPEPLPQPEYGFPEIIQPMYGYPVCES